MQNLLKELNVTTCVHIFSFMHRLTECEAKLRLNGIIYKEDVYSFNSKTRSNEVIKLERSH